MTFNPINSQAVFIATSRNFNVEEEDLPVILSQYYREIAYAVNVKEIASYDTAELLNGQQYFDPNNAQKKRYVYRKVFSVGAVAAGATLNTNHSITSITAFTRIYGTCITDVVDFRPLPYASVTANANIELRASATQFTIINGAASPNITSAFVILEYLKN